jgi:hypothetical protein
VGAREEKSRVIESSVGSRVWNIWTSGVWIEGKRSIDESAPDRIVRARKKKRRTTNHARIDHPFILLPEISIRHRPTLLHTSNLLDPQQAGLAHASSASPGGRVIVVVVHVAEDLVEAALTGGDLREHVLGGTGERRRGGGREQGEAEVYCKTAIDQGGC